MVYLNDIPVNGNLPQICRHVPGGYELHFSSIKSRSASVTLNLICTVLLRPFMYSLLSFPFRGFGTLPNKQFSTDAPQRGRGKYGKWVPASYACYECFYPLCLTTELCPVLPNFRKRKTLQSSKKITTLSKPYSILTDTSYLPSVSTSAISFAVALTIRMPVSLIPSRSASSCRRCVFFSGGVSKRNWSTDIL